MTIQSTVLAVLIGGMTPSGASAQVAKPTTMAALTERFAEEVRRGPIPGFSVAIVTAAGPVLSAGFGVADEATRRPYDAGTIQPVGSISKTLIALVLASAVEAKVVELDGPIDPWLPFSLARATGSKPITLRHLATHTSGIVDVEETYAKAYQEGPVAPATNEEFLRSYLTRDGRLYRAQHFASEPPGAVYRYSNVGAALAALVLERALKEPFDQYTDRVIFKPLGLQDTHWSFDPKRQSSYSRIHDGNGKPRKEMSLATYPDGALRSSARDLARFVQELLLAREGKSEILTRAVVETMFEAQFREGKQPTQMDPKEPRRALFWAYNRRGWLRHTGGDPGYAAFVSIDPEQGVGRVLLVNIDLETNPQAVAQVVRLTELLNDYVPVK